MKKKREKGDCCGDPWMDVNHKRKEAVETNDSMKQRSMLHRRRRRRRRGASKLNMKVAC